MMRSTRRSCCGVEVQAAEVGGGVVVVEPAAHGVFERLGLLEDLLEHVVLEAALVGVARLKIQLVNGSRACTWAETSFALTFRHEATTKIEQIIVSIKVFFIAQLLFPEF